MGRMQGVGLTDEYLATFSRLAPVASLYPFTTTGPSLIHRLGPDEVVPVQHEYPPRLALFRNEQDKLVIHAPEEV
jgi:hypothetical protein